MTKNKQMLHAEYHVQRTKLEMIIIFSLLQSMKKCDGISIPSLKLLLKKLCCPRNGIVIILGFKMALFIDVKMMNPKRFWIAPFLET